MSDLLKRRNCIFLAGFIVGCLPIIMGLFLLGKDHLSESEIHAINKKAYYKLLSDRGEKFEKIRIGMTPDEVIQAAGMPQGTGKNGPWVIWVYDQAVENPECIQRRLVRFKNGKVNEIENFDILYMQMIKESLASGR